MKRIGVDLSRRRTQVRWPDRSLALVERNLMIGYYIIRKLMEAKKLSDQYTGQSVRLRLHRRIGKVPDVLDWHRVEHFVDLGKPVLIDRSLKFLCDQVVHSFVFMVSTADEGGLDGFFVASDRARSSCIYFVAVEDAVATFLGAANDEIKAASWNRGSDGLTAHRLDDSAPVAFDHDGDGA
ncbi:MAG: hypothetical protein ABIO70_25865 [Pseudomonadota bacterium]